MPDIQPPIQPPTQEEIASRVQAIIADIRSAQARCQGEAFLPWQVALKKLGDSAQLVYDRRADFAPR